MQKLSQELIEVNEAISAVLKRKEYTYGDKSVKSEDLSSLRVLRKEILENISYFGSGYIMGQDTEPSGDTSLVSFS